MWVFTSFSMSDYKNCNAPLQFSAYLTVSSKLLPPVVVLVTERNRTKGAFC